MHVSNAQHTNILPAPADGTMFSSGSSPQRVLVWSIQSYHSKGKFHTMTLLRVRQLEKQCLTLYARSNSSVFQLWMVYFLRKTMSLKQHIQSVICDRTFYSISWKYHYWLQSMVSTGRGQSPHIRCCYLAHFEHLDHILFSTYYNCLVVYAGKKVWGSRKLVPPPNPKKIK